MVCLLQYILFLRVVVSAIEKETTVINFKRVAPEDIDMDLSKLSIHIQKFRTTPLVKDVTEFSYCGRFNLNAIVSQALFTIKSGSNQLGLDLDLGNLGQTGYVFFDKSWHLFVIKNQPVLPKQWHSICYSVNATDNNSLSIVFDGELLNGSKKGIIPVYIRSDKMNNATLKLGLLPVVKNGAWNPKTYSRFDGLMSEIYMWTSPLSIDNMIQFTKGCKSPAALQLTTPDLFDWSKYHNFSKYETKYISVFKLDVQSAMCNKFAMMQLNFIPYHTTFDEAVNICHGYGGRMVTVNTFQEAQVLTGQIGNANFGQMFVEPCNNEFWSGGKQSADGHWRSIYEHTKIDVPWSPSQPNGLDHQKCLAAYMHLDRSM
jgi:hypothetical protein